MLSDLNIFFLSAMLSIRSLLQLSLLLPLITRFSPGLFVVLREILYQPGFALVRLLEKIIHFQSKTFFFLSTY